MKKRSPWLFSLCLVPWLAFGDVPEPAMLGDTCAGCHGTDGMSPGPIPPICGMPETYIIKAMKDYKTGKRPGTIMDRIAKGYTDAEIEAVAGYFANKQCVQ